MTHEGTCRLGHLCGSATATESCLRTCAWTAARTLPLPPSRIICCHPHSCRGASTGTNPMRKTQRRRCPRPFSRRSSPWLVTVGTGTPALWAYASSMPSRATALPSSGQLAWFTTILGAPPSFSTKRALTGRRARPRATRTPVFAARAGCGRLPRGGLCDVRHPPPRFLQPL